MSAVFVCLLASTWIVSGLAVAQAPPDVVAAGRSFFSCLGLCLLALRGRGALGRAAVMLRRRPIALGSAGVLGVSIYALASLRAIALVGISLPNLLLATTPCVSLVLGVLVFGKRAPRRAVVGVALASVGAAGYVLATFRLGASRPSTLWLGIAAGLVAVFAIAVYGQYYGKISKGHDPLDLLPGIFLIGTLVVLVVLAVSGRLGAVFSLPWKTTLLLFTLGVVIYVPVYVIQHQLIHLRGAVYMASLSLVVPFLVRGAQMITGHAGPPGPFELLGLVVCVAGVALVVRHPVTDR